MVEGAFQKLFFFVAILFAVLFFTLSRIPSAHAANNYSFSDNFVTDTPGSPVFAANGWKVGDASDTLGALGNWKIATTSIGNIARWFPDASSNYNYYLQYMSNGVSTLGDGSLQADFEVPATGTFNYSPPYYNYSPQFWLRRTSLTGDGGGYGVYYESGQWVIFKHLAGTAGSFITLASATTSISIATGTWYTGVYQVANSATGTPVLSFWVYPQGQSKPAQPQISIADVSSTFSTGYFALGACFLTVDFANVNVQATDTAGLLNITSPVRGVSASSSVATLNITNSRGSTFTIPYIQTSNTLPVSATMGSSYVPSGGGVKFVLTNTATNQQQSLSVLNNPTSTYAASFANLSKGTYTLDAYVVDSNGTVQGNSWDHDQATNIGIGDIITAIGDSITAGYPTSYGHPANWLQAIASSSPISNDDRNYPQEDYFNTAYEAGYPTTLNNILSSYYGYPVFIMNEGVSSYKASDYITFMSSTQWTSRENALVPSKWIVMLGVNDADNGVTSSTYSTNMQAIISNLENNLNAPSSSIFLAKPTFIQASTTASNLEATYLPKIDSLVSINGISAGPNFYSYFENYYPALYTDTLHPNTNGYAEMADLWSLPLLAPQNVTANSTVQQIALSWNSLSTINSQINDYKVSYGTSSGNYGSTYDAGNATTATISNLGSNIGYYFTVTGYYSDSTSTTLNPTANSTEVFAYAYAPSLMVSVPAGYIAAPPISTQTSTLAPIPAPASTPLPLVTPNQQPQSSTQTIISVRNLHEGILGSDVFTLQHYLNTHGFPVNIFPGVGSLGHETNYFGAATVRALIKLQLAEDISPAVGYFGPITRAWIDSH